MERDVLEDAVIDAICSDMLTDEMIGQITDKIMDLQMADQKHERLHVLERQLAEAQKRQEELLDALEIAPDVSGLIDRIRAVDDEIKGLKSEIAGESIKQPTLSRDVILLWLNQFKNGDVTDADFRSRLVETFFNVTGRDRQKGLPTIRQVDLKTLSANLFITENHIIFRVKIPA